MSRPWSKNSRPEILDPQEFFVEVGVVGIIRRDVTQKLRQSGVPSNGITILFLHTNTLESIQDSVDLTRQYYPQFKPHIDCVAQNCGLSF